MTKLTTTIVGGFVAGLLALFPATSAVAATKKVAVVTTLNVLAGITREIGHDRVSVTALAKANQDPHTLVAKPTFKVLAKNANLFVELGLGLDIWGSAVTDASGNTQTITTDTFANAIARTPAPGLAPRSRAGSRASASSGCATCSSSRRSSAGFS